MSKPVLVLVTAKDCGHCVRFRPLWKPDNPNGPAGRGIRDEIERTGLVRVIDIEHPSRSQPPNFSSYPRDLTRYIQWFPMFLLFTGESWDTASASPNKEGRLDGVVFNGTLVNGIPRNITNGIPLTKDNLINWIRTETSKMSSPGKIVPLLPQSGVSEQSGTAPGAGSQGSYAPRSNNGYMVPTSGSRSCGIQKYRGKNP
jgi:hypothetical protein